MSLVSHFCADQQAAHSLTVVFTAIAEQEHLLTLTGCGQVTLLRELFGARSEWFLQRESPDDVDVELKHA